MVFVTLQIWNHWPEYREIQSIIIVFCESIIFFVRGCHCDFSTHNVGEDPSYATANANETDRYRTFSVTLGESEFWELKRLQRSKILQVNKFEMFVRDFRLGPR